MEDNIKYCIATFCFGEIYYKQCNRLIGSFKDMKDAPIIVVLTDNESKINNEWYVKIVNVNKYNKSYSKYDNNYYTFDFSVKRYSLLAALELGFSKIILTDADAVRNVNLYSHELINKLFSKNSIQGQVCYSFNNEINGNSNLGSRFLQYEEKFNTFFDKDKLESMPEDCIQFIDIDTPKFYKFLSTWDSCIKLKYDNNMPNIPAGNIDEMCFAALYNGIKLKNNSSIAMNVLNNIHDKWYINDGVSTVNYDDIQTKTNNKVVTAVYNLKYIHKRGGGGYKSSALLLTTISKIIYDDYVYVIYTDKNTYDKFNLKDVFTQSNVTIKFKELNSDFYINKLLPIKNKKNSEGELYDRIYCVDNYVEVMFNKFEFLLEESKDYEGNVLWIDAGLFGTSCANEWRDYMNKLCHSEKFVNKCFEKINQYGVISLKGNGISMNYEEREKLSHMFKKDIFIIPGGLFGGKSTLISEYFKDYKSIIKKIVDTYDFYTSDQEILCITLSGNDQIHFFEIDDWNDLQKGILKIMDLFDTNNYDKELCHFKEENINYVKILSSGIQKYIMKDTIDISNKLTNDEILSLILSVTNEELDKLDLTHNDYMLSKMTSFATLYYFPSGREHYRLLTYISKLFKNETIFDIGTCNGCSAIALSENQTTQVESYDVVNYMDGDMIDRKNINFYLKDVLQEKEKLLNSRFIMLDTNHTGTFENKVYNTLKEINYKGFLFLDDIFINGDMKTFWNSIVEEKFNISHIGHSTGTGLVYFR
jgi:hypothetical protein